MGQRGGTPTRCIANSQNGGLYQCTEDAAPDRVKCPNHLDIDREQARRRNGYYDRHPEEHGEKNLPSTIRKREIVTDPLVLGVRERHQVELSKLENRNTETIEGFVYILTNPAWPEWVKIGSAIDPFSRSNGYQTGSPFRDYVLQGYSYAGLRVKVEKMVQRACGAKPGQEWAKITVAVALVIMEKICLEQSTKRSDAA